MFGEPSLAANWLRLSGMVLMTKFGSLNSFWVRDGLVEDRVEEHVEELVGAPRLRRNWASRAIADCADEREHVRGVAGPVQLLLQGGAEGETGTQTEIAAKDMVQTDQS